MVTARAKGKGCLASDTKLGKIPKFVAKLNELYYQAQLISTGSFNYYHFITFPNVDSK